MERKLKVVDSQLINEFEKLPLDYWDFRNEDTKEMTHGIHTYPAVMVYPISREIIKTVKKYQDLEVLLDPFMGSGTSLVEGIVAGFSKVYGTDLNPLARLISKVKTRMLSYEELERQVEVLQKDIEKSYVEFRLILQTVYEHLENKGIDISEKATVKEGWGASAPDILKLFIKEHNKELQIPDFKNIGYWFVPNAIIELQIIKNAISKIDNLEIREFIMAAFSETTRLVSNRRNGEFKMYRMPAEKVKEFRPDVKNEFFSILANNIEKMKEFTDRCGDKATEVYVLNNDARELNDVPDNTVDIVVTSPPYGDSRTTVAYGEFSRVSLQWMDLENIEPADITGIDKSLMGGDKYRKGFDYNLKSDTLKKSLTKILEDPKSLERAGDVYSFYEDLEKSIEAITRKCKDNSYQFWVVGNRTVKNENLKTSEIIIEMGEHFGLKHVHTIARNIPNKVMPSLNSPTNEAGKKVTTMTNEHILVLRKEKA